MGYHDNKPVRMSDEKKQIKDAAKALDPENYGESAADRIADKAVEKIKEYGESGRADRDNRQEQDAELKKIIKQTVKEEL